MAPEMSGGGNDKDKDKDEVASLVPSTVSVYKGRQCKYCRTMSSARSPFPDGVFPAWDPNIPWHQGKRERPLGQICKVCMIAARMYLILVDNYVNYISVNIIQSNL